MARFRHKSQKADALADIPMFAGLSKADRQLLASHVDEAEVDAGTALSEQGKRGKQLFLIVEGAAKVERDGKHLADLGAGDVVGEMSLIDQTEGSATVTTTEPAVVLVMHAKDFSQLIDESPAFARRIMKALAGRLREADRQLIG